MFGFTEILIVVLILVVLFGGARLAGVGKGLGEGIRGLVDGFKRDNGDDG
jgi:TatA/E family protein of Tat protein translocase